MKNVSKAFVVLIAIISVAFMALLGVGRIGGPNWSQEAVADDLKDDYVFTSKVSADGTETWTVTRRVGGEEVVGNASSLPSAVLQLRKKISTDQTQEINDLDTRINQLKQKIARTEEEMAADLKAIELREQQLVTELENLNQQILRLSEQSVAQSQTAQERHRELQLRRDEVFRLRNQLAEIRTEMYAAQQQQALLEDQIIRIQGNIIRLEQRRDQLLKDGATAPASVP